MRVLTVVGTRPEAIKLAPVVRELLARPDVEHVLCATGQHRGLLDGALATFGLTPDHDLDLLSASPGLAGITGGVLERLDRIIADRRPDWLIVQGDTQSAFSAALAASLARIPVAHVEAGLRTGDRLSPWPEENNRRLIAVLADLHFAPTAAAAAALRAEGVAEAAIEVTGNSGIDALHLAVERLDGDSTARAHANANLSFLDPVRRLVLVTGHRRENLGRGMDRVCEALRKLADRGDVQLLYAVHRNPAARCSADRLLAGHEAIHRVEPLDYLTFVAALRRAHVVITDSGGIQEEAPTLGRPVLVTRGRTERGEVVAAGGAALVGTDPDAILAAAERLLDDADAYERMARPTQIYGDGRAAVRIVDRLVGRAG